MMMSSSKYLFREVFKLLKTVLTVPVPTVTAERSFSTLQRLKTYVPAIYHVTTKVESHCAPASHKERTDALDLAHVAKTFVSVNNRRQMFCGKF